MARLVNPFEQFFDSAGDPLVSGKLFCYESGSATVFKDTFADSGETIANSNPVILNGDGRSPNVFGTGTYRIVLTDKDDVQILSRDPVGGNEGTPFGADWISTKIYDETDVVRDNGRYWISQTNNNLNNKPSTDDGTNWQVAIVEPDNVSSVFETVSEMKTVALSSNQLVETKGYYKSGDSGKASYLIKTAAQAAIDGDIIDGFGNHELANSNVAILQFSRDVSVLSYGAVGDGVTDSTANFQACVDSLNASGGQIYVGEFPKNFIVSPITYSGKIVKWRGTSRVNGSALWSLGALQESFDPVVNRTFRIVENGDQSSAFNWDYTREADYDGGPTGNPNTLLRVFTDVASTVGGDPNGGTGDGRKAEWAFQARIDNNSNWANAVASTGQARRFANGACWAGQFNVLDNTSPTSTHASRAIEANIQADGGDAQNLRLVVEAVAHNLNLNYTGSDNIYTAFQATADTADLKYGLVIREIPTRGKILSSAILTDMSGNASFLECVNADSTINDKRTTGLDSGTLSDMIVTGKNSIDEDTEYSRFRTNVTSSTDGSEIGQMVFQVMKSGVLSSVVSINGVDDSLNITVGGTLKKIVQGTPDSGGAGFRILRVSN